MRVSEKLRYDTVENRVAQAKDANGAQMDRLASNKDIMKLSDGPLRAKQAIRYRDQISDLGQFQKNIEFSKGLLTSSESALAGIGDNLIRLKELAIGMANATYDKQSRDATSREVREVMEEIVQLGNTTFNGRYVFGGFRNQTPPLNLEGDYMGDDGALFLQISNNNFRQVNLQARNLFEPPPEDRSRGHYNMLQATTLFYEGLVNNDQTMIRKAITELDFHMEKTTSYQATIGGMWKSLGDAASRLSGEEVQAKAGLSKAEDADIYDATSQFKRTEATLQGTLMASSKMLQPSLLNFLQ